jgi:hypothetical protein
MTAAEFAAMEGLQAAGAAAASTATATGGATAGATATAATAAGISLAEVALIAGPWALVGLALLLNPDESGAQEDARAAAAMQELQRNPALAEQYARDPWSANVDFRQAMENLEGVPNAQALRDQFVANLGGADLRWPGGVGEMMGGELPAITTVKERLVPVTMQVWGWDEATARATVNTWAPDEIAYWAQQWGVEGVTWPGGYRQANTWMNTEPSAGGGGEGGGGY